MDLHVFPIPILPPTSLTTQTFWVFPVHQAEETRSERATCTPSIIAALFIIARTWKQLQVLLAKSIATLPFPICSALAAAKSCQSCPTVHDPKAGGPPTSSVPGILQATILEWVAISFSIPVCSALCNVILLLQL